MRDSLLKTQKNWVNTYRVEGIKKDGEAFNPGNLPHFKREIAQNLKLITPH